jgi:hypothetical protein
VKRRNIPCKGRLFAILAPLVLTAAWLGHSGSASAEQPAPAAQLLAESDRARGALSDGLAWTVKLEDLKDGKKSERTYRVRARGDDALVETLEPPRQRGELMLFNGRTIWFFKPGLHSPISLSAKQRLAGQASNGDIAATNYARDYTATSSVAEAVGGIDATRLELQARASDATYDRIRYWISGAKLGVKAEFLAVSGKVYRVARFRYENRLELNGKKFDFISRTEIKDAAREGSSDVTTLTYTGVHPENCPPGMFNVNNLMR